jgi:7,8-dihydro-6-hydroxymethylpterin-pyrophosphokinase
VCEREREQQQQQQRKIDVDIEQWSDEKRGGSAWVRLSKWMRYRASMFMSLSVDVEVG